METKIRELIEKYRDEMQGRNNDLDPYRGENGDVIPGDQSYYDEQRTDNAYDSEVDLITLLDELEALITPKESK